MSSATLLIHSFIQGLSASAIRTPPRSSITRQSFELSLRRCLAQLRRFETEKSYPPSHLMRNVQSLVAQAGHSILKDMLSVGPIFLAGSSVFVGGSGVQKMHPLVCPAIPWLGTSRKTASLSFIKRAFVIR